MTQILLNWQASNLFAWGILGLQMFEQWARRDDVQPLMGHPFDATQLFDPALATSERGRQKVAASNGFAQEIAAALERHGSIRLNVPVVNALGIQYACYRHNVSGSVTAGRMVFEDTFLDHATQSPRRYDFYICISEWNAQLLRDDVDEPVVTIHEGIDPRRYFPGPRPGRFDAGLFHVFSGSKIEYKKGQDQVLRAFRAFHARHPDARLVVAWQSPWSKTGAVFPAPVQASIVRLSSGLLDIKRWIADNGLDPESVIDLGLVPNSEMPEILRDMDCALVPSRCEGGTSLVAMEAMACGVPTILPANTGLLDLIADGNCIALRRQTPTPPDAEEGRDGWCDSDVDEIVEALERLYTSTDLRRCVGAAAVATMRERTWERHAELTRRCILSGPASLV